MKSFYRDENHVWIHVDQLKGAEGEPTSFLNVARTQSHLSGNNPVAKFNQHRIIINSDILNSAGEIGIDKTFLLMAFIHEADHARKNERLRQDPKSKTYPGYLDFVLQRPKDGNHHNLMGEYNRNILVDAMKEYDAQAIKEGGTVPSYHTEEWYQAMSWYGLTKTKDGADTKTWSDFKENNPDKAKRYVELIEEQIERNEEGVNE